MVLVDSHFLDSLPQNEMRSGLAELLKHGLIHSETYWNDLNNLNTLTLDDLEKLIHESIVIKNNIVSIDPNENGLRKTLNYGHTLGHAIESFCLENKNKTTLLHGEAIVIGMILATYLSYELVGFPENKLHDIKNALIKLYGKTNFNIDEINAIIELMKFDKKNSHGNINFVLLEDIGKAKIDQIVSNELIHKAFYYYQA
jgi:3-dehydroquinate synthase